MQRLCINAGARLRFRVRRKFAIAFEADLCGPRLLICRRAAGHWPARLQARPRTRSCRLNPFATQFITSGGPEVAGSGRYIHSPDNNQKPRAHRAR